MPNYSTAAHYPVRGIDVSRHQGSIDWKAVSASGIRFVYLKATEGGDFQDASFRQNLRAASDLGLACGAYHFFSLKTPGSVQARNFIGTVPVSGMTLPPAVDLEFWGNASERPTPEAFQQELRTYLDAVRQADGREPVIYTSSDFSGVYLKNFQVRRSWVRDIALGPWWDGNQGWLFWQFSDRGRVPGIDGYVDLDVFNGGEESFGALVREVGFR